MHVLGQNKQVDLHSIDQLFEEKIEVYFVFQISNIDDIISLTEFISIDNLDGNLVFAYANKKGFLKFASLGYEWKILPSPGETINPVMLNNISSKSIKAWDFYPTYEAYDSIMHQFGSDFPAICEMHSLGQLPSGRELLAVKISDNVSVREAEPQFFYTSTMHGDELVGYILMLRLIDYLLTNYGIDPDVTNMIDNMEIWINPNANPDGTYQTGNHTVYGATRMNSNGVDLNRNYPDPQDGPHPDGNPWQPETILFMNFADSMDFVMSANLHSGAELVNYPWDTWAKLHADNDWWFSVSREYADTVHLHSPSGYLNDMNNGISNGYAWYTINGGRQDYMNYFEHCREFTLELSNVKILPETQLEDHWDYNYRSLLNYMEEAMYGISGIITDSCTGQPIKAEVFVNNHDFDESNVFSSLPLGNYHRPVYTGLYSLTFSAPGYYSKTYNNIQAVGGLTTTLNVILQPLNPQADFTVDNTFSCSGLINFYDLSLAPAGTTYEWDFGDGTFSNQENPSHNYINNGIYSVKLKLVSICTGVDSIVKTDLIEINKPADPIVTDTNNCGPGSFLLHAPGPGSLEWFDTAVGGIPVDTGNYFQTPILHASVIYYVQSVVANPSQYTGKPGNTGGGGFYSSNTSHFLYFDAYEPLQLLSVKVYADGDGYRNIELRDNSGSVLQSKNIFVPDGESRINLDFDIPAGSDLQLAGPASPYLYRNNNGVSYPYEIQGLVSITGSSAGAGYYYYFYDWEVRKMPCISNRVPLKITINQGKPIADFDYTFNGNTVFFNNNSVDANEYFWDFGDGDTSLMKSPKHEYSFLGPYDVKLIVTNSCGDDTLTKQIVITGLNRYSEITNFDVFPNPTNGSFKIFYSSLKEERYELIITNLIGVKVFSEYLIIKPGLNTKIYNLKHLDTGVYIITLRSVTTVITRKLLFQ